MIQLINPLYELQARSAHRQAVACALFRDARILPHAIRDIKELDGDRELPATRKQSL